MFDDDMIAIPITYITGQFYGTIGSSIYRRSLWCGKIKTRMPFGCFINRINAIAKTGG
jgi:hypothetical protein